uniref:CSON008241 protein n=1 Tax=Culicoides sonorensis TaxID=179676 RepID=A0A336LET3_CULSO
MLGMHLTGNCIEIFTDMEDCLKRHETSNENGVPMKISSKNLQIDMSNLSINRVMSDNNFHRKSVNSDKGIQVSESSFKEFKETLKVHQTSSPLKIDPNEGESTSNNTVDEEFHSVAQNNQSEMHFKRKSSSVIGIGPLFDSIPHENDPIPCQSEPKSTCQEINVKNTSQMKPIHTTLKLKRGSSVIQREYVPQKEMITKNPKKKTLYRTTIEHNRQGNYKIKCPNCHKKRYPMIFCHKESVSQNSTISTLIMKFWASCFLPSMFPVPAKEYVKCSNCGHFLGVFNHHLQVLEVNENLLKSYNETK